MKLFKKILLLVLILAIAFIAHVVITTGYFRTINNSFDGKILKKIELSGAEDITISQVDSFAIISATDRQKLPPVEEEKGGLYYVDLKNKAYDPIHLTANFKKPFAPHGISIFKTDSTYKILAINHTPKGHFIEVFKMQGQNVRHIETLEHSSMVSPNDIIQIDADRFYFTNDHKYTRGIGRFIEDYGGRAISNVIYFDGKNYTEVADGISYANGINFDANRDLLYVASPRKFLVKVYKKNSDGSLDFIENIDCGTGVDNIEFDTEGNLWIGAHPNLLRFASYAKGKKETSPSEIIKITYREKGDFDVEKIYIEDGNEMSASTVAAPFGKLIFTGNVMDNKFLILEREN